VTEPGGSDGSGPVRVGLVGTGHWARVTHGPVLAHHPDVELVAVWGRRPPAVAEVGEALGVATCDSFDDLLAQVDAVSFAVPPDVQAELAERAALQGKHLLLDKPVATSVAAAERVAAAVEQAGVASVVFFTSRFKEATRGWLSSVAGGSWDGAWARWIVSAFGPGSPYAGSTWRRERGALWDAGPHALALLTAALGPIERVSADAGRNDLVHLVATHSSGATSTVSLTLHAPSPAVHVELALWGEQGIATMPHDTTSSAEALAVAVGELAAAVRTGRRDHPCDVRFGADVVALLAEAERRAAVTSS